jgi:transposase
VAYQQVRGLANGSDDALAKHATVCNLSTVNHRLILVYLTPYSPELNPIEILWKQAKCHWRKLTTWAKEDLPHEVSAIFQGYGSKFKIRYA